MKKSEETTKKRIEKLSASLGDFDIFKEEKEVKTSPKPTTSYFRTSEVVILLLLTTVVSLLMGGLVMYKLSYSSGKLIDNSLREFIKNYEYITENYYDKVDKNKLIDAAIAGMLETLDKNSSYVGSTDSSFNIFLEGNYKGVGLQVYNDEKMNVVIYNVIDNSPAKAAGLETGDIILKINEKSVLGKTTDEVSKLIMKQKNEFSITVKRGEEEKVFKIKVSDISLKSVDSEVIVKNDKKIGYIRVTIFANNTDSQFKKHLEKLEEDSIDSLIIDLRDNSGGHLTTAENIISLFLDSSHPIYQIKSKTGVSKYYSKGKTTKKYKIAVIINGDSASASEVTASALREQYGATVVGQKSFGKGTVQELQTLNSGEQYKLTTKTWLTSNGDEVNGKGITPDVEVLLDEKYNTDPTEANDNQLQKAIESVLK